MADIEMLGGVCGNCLRLPPPWREIFFHGAYQHRLRELILQLKFAEGLHIAEGLGALLAVHPHFARMSRRNRLLAVQSERAETMPQIALAEQRGLAQQQAQQLALTPRADGALQAGRSAQTGGNCSADKHVERDSFKHPYARVIPVPLHASRLRERGFNQSALLAAPLAGALGVKLDLKSLKRFAPTGHQTGLTREQRRRNVSRAFRCEADLGGLSILLVDDVLTTGATMAAAAQTLLQAGAASVDVAVVARTPARNMVGWA